MTTPIPLHRTNYQAGPSGSPPPSPPPAYGTPYGSWESNASSNRENRRPSPPSSPSHSARSTSQIVDVVAKKTMSLKDALWLLIDQAHLPQLRSVTEEQERAMDANMQVLFSLFESCMPVMKTKIFSEKKRFYHPAFGNEKGPGEGDGNKVGFTEFFVKLFDTVCAVKEHRLLTAWQIVFGWKAVVHCNELSEKAKGGEIIQKKSEYWALLMSNTSEAQWSKIYRDEPYDEVYKKLHGARAAFLKKAVEDGYHQAVGHVGSEVLRSEETRTQESIAACDRRIAANNAATNAMLQYAAAQRASQRATEPAYTLAYRTDVTTGNLVSSFEPRNAVFTYS